MKVYSRISLHCTKKATNETITMLNDFYKNYEKYLINKDIGMYLIPIDTDIYKEVMELKEFSPQEIYVYEHFEKKYSTEDYVSAQAYVINFTNMCYGYTNKSASDYFDKCCEKGNLLLNQVKDYEMPKGQMKNKDFAQIDLYRFIISQKVRNELNLLGVDDNIFRPVWQKDKNDTLAAYQISPVNILPSIAEENGWKSSIGCKYCKKLLYNWEDNMPYYITKKAVESFKDFNITQEVVGNLCTPLYIVNKKIYTFLKSQYKKMYFEPMFFK